MRPIIIADSHPHPHRHNHNTPLPTKQMKLSVVLGIIHMTWGILLRGANALYFKQNVDLIFEFLPMIIFDLALFGCVLVVGSWGGDGGACVSCVCLVPRREVSICVDERTVGQTDGRMGACLFLHSRCACPLTVGPFGLEINRYMVVLIFTKWAINWDDRMLAASCQAYDVNTDTWGPCPDATSTCYVFGNGPLSGKRARTNARTLAWVSAVESIWNCPTLPTLASSPFTPPLFTPSHPNRASHR
jgi:vacuolar-type H+-ATPase subunit I/STV1